MKVEEFMKEGGWTTYETDMGTKSMTTQTYILVTSQEGRLMVKVSTLGLMVNTMKESGKWDKSTGLENGKATEENHTLEIGLKERLMVLGLMFGKVEMFMKADGICV